MASVPPPLDPLVRMGGGRNKLCFSREYIRSPAEVIFNGLHINRFIKRLINSYISSLKFINGYIRYPLKITSAGDRIYSVTKWSCSSYVNNNLYNYVTSSA